MKLFEFFVVVVLCGILAQLLILNFNIVLLIQNVLLIK